MDQAHRVMSHVPETRQSDVVDGETSMMPEGLHIIYLIMSEIV